MIRQYSAYSTANKRSSWSYLVFRSPRGSYEEEGIFNLFMYYVLFIILDAPIASKLVSTTIKGVSEIFSFT